jgi:ABC-2 type transport system permease protein
MRSATLIAAKDLKLRIRDRSAFIVGILAPLLLAFIFNAILGGVAGGDFVPVFSVTNLDGGTVGGAFVSVLDEIEAEGVIEIAERPDSVAAAEQLAEDGTVAAAIIIPEGFSEAVQSGGESAVIVVTNSDSPTSGEIARSIATGFVAEIQAAQLAVETTATAAGGTLTAAEIGQLAQVASAGLPQVISVGAFETVKRELDLATFFAAAMSVFFLFFTVSFGVNGLLEERQQGTLSRLMGAPIRSLSIVGGKALVSFVLGIVSMTILIVASSLLIGADWGNPLGVAALVVMGVVAATGLMMVVAAFAKTPEQAGNLMAILAVGLGMLGGIFFPTGLGTGFLSYLAYISPHRWFLLGLTDLAAGDAVTSIIPALIGLFAFAAVGWTIAIVKFRSTGLAL